MQNQINTTPITQFIQNLRAAELAQQKEVKIPEANASICTNCDHYTHCMWQSNNKMFCEHYQ